MTGASFPQASDGLDRRPLLTMPTRSPGPSITGERPLRGAPGCEVFVAVCYVAAASTSASFRANTASSTAYSASSTAACAN